MSSEPKATQVFLSTVSDDFEKPGAPFAGLRSRLRFYLNRAQGQKAIAQEEFPQVQVPTLQKLDNLLRPCSTVIHLIGGKAGAQPSADEVREYLDEHPGFLAGQPALLAALGDFSDVSYTQWEAFMALHYGRDLFVYQSPDAGAQQTHLDRLKIASPKKYAIPFKNEAELLGQLIGDLHTQLPALAEATKRKLASSRIPAHAPEIIFGREEWLDELDTVWAEGRVNVYALIAWGGSGKTSVVKKWIAERIIPRQWPGVERYFDWSFYSQGAREQAQSSADFFIAAALTFFGDPDPQKGSPWERGERLAELVRQHRTLLVLDGVEPLQYPPNSPQRGEFKDAALAALLESLAMDNPGLCIVTSRESLTALQSYHGGPVLEKPLNHLRKEAALALLRRLQITGTDEELAEAWQMAGGHALTLHLLGRFIAQAYPDKDIRHYREVKLLDVDRQTAGRTVEKVLLAYEKWLQSAGPDRQRDLAVLRLTGLFDRPAGPGCLAALRKEPAIPGLTEDIVKLKDTEWNAALRDLECMELVALTSGNNASYQPSTINHQLTIDAHPLVREHFAAQLRKEQPEAFRAAHSRLFDYLCESAPEFTNIYPRRAQLMQPIGVNSGEKKLPTLGDLEPLYRAIVHGCLAGREQKACDDVFYARVLRLPSSGIPHSTLHLGATGADMVAIAAFFEQRWDRLSQNLNLTDQAWLLNEAAYRLRALGRTAEALEPLRLSLKMAEGAKIWVEAATRASNLSELEVTLGLLDAAAESGHRAIEYADRSKNASWRVICRATFADALHQLGKTDEARARFAKAERRQRELNGEFRFLCSVRGFRYADLLLAPAETVAWHQISLVGAVRAPVGESNRDNQTGIPGVGTCDEVEVRTIQTLQLGTKEGFSMLDIALDHLTLARARLYRVLLLRQQTFEFSDSHSDIQAALTKLREAGQVQELPKALLTAALYHGAAGEPAEAQRRLDEAERIARRGPMPLYLADVHLHRARLFGPLPAEERAKFPGINPRAELAEARRLIEKHGYWRRREELADAEAGAEHWSA